MKLVAFAILSVILSGIVQAQQDRLDMARDVFFNKWGEECAAKGLYQSFKGLEMSEMSPLLLAYRGVARASMAECAFFPLTKLSYFNEGKAELEDAIKRDPDNVEIRFIRFAMQTNIPSLLMYDDIVEDKTFILNEIAKDPSLGKLQYAGRIYNYMLEWDGLADTERTGLKNLSTNDGKRE